MLLLRSGLQVDLSFWPHDQPLAAGAPIKVLSGEVPVAQPSTVSGGGDPTNMCGSAGCTPCTLALH